MTPAKAADHIVRQHLQREFVLASAERALATSGSVPPFSVFSLPDHFEWAWPLHVLLPNELAPLNAPFMCKTTMHEFRQESSRGGPNKLSVKSLESSLPVAKFIMQTRDSQMMNQNEQSLLCDLSLRTTQRASSTQTC
jgi:hypothetical protein